MSDTRHLGRRSGRFESGLALSRRDLLKIFGAGIVVMFTGGGVLAQEGEAELPTDFNAFLRIGEDGRVTLFTGKIEMGQGPITSLAQMLADELDVRLDSVDMVMGDTDLCPYDEGTWGSMTTRFFGPPLRAAGAEARAVLLELASERLGKPVGQLEVEDGVVFDKANRGARVSYAELAKGKRIVRHAKAEVKAPSALKVMGKPVLRSDARVKVTGAAKYCGDIRLPGMLYAKVLRPPAHGATFRSVDSSAVAQVKGAQVVQDGDFVAVLHALPDEAERAFSKLKADFAPSPTSTSINDTTIFDYLLGAAEQGEDEERRGDVTKGETRATEVFDKTYLNSYVAHAPIEPHTAVAQFENGKMTVWASTQSPFGAKSEIVEELKLPAEKVRVITPFVGGGFGGKGRNLQVVEAARLAKLTGKPVQVAWSRAEEFFDDSFRPAAIVKIKSGLDRDGRIAFWDYHVYYAGTRGAELFYDVADFATVRHGSGWDERPHPFATGAWRAPGNNTNTFARESQIEIMAAKAGADPVEFRLKHLKDEKMRGVLIAAAKQFGWRSAKLGPGRGCGLALGIDSGTYVATIAEAEVDEKTGAVQVTRVVAAQNMGLVINPEGARIQMEGCITMGLGYALTEEVHFRGGDVVDRSFASYQLPRFSWLPKIETVFVENKNDDAQGGGEPAIITMGGAVANAICAATGARLLQLPMTPERVAAALKQRA
ncbi:MAG: molybdopterin cofactor-binding domain-containing protein [Armatimonadota bacterium]